MPFPRTVLPVRLPDQNDDGTYEAGLGFDDYSRAHTESHKLFKGRAAPPSWATNLRQLGELLARYLELRALMQHPRVDSPERRVVYAQNKILKRIPVMIARLDRLQEERLALIAAGGDPDRIRG